MNQISFDINPVLSHTAVVLPHSREQAASSFAATAVADNTGFFVLTLGNAKDVMTDEQIKIVMWRINIQIIAIQLSEYKQKNISNEEREEWKSRIWESLWRLNQKAQLLNIQSLPNDLPLAMGEWVVQNANGGNWCDTLTRELTCLFSSAPDADIMRTD